MHFPTATTILLALAGSTIATDATFSVYTQGGCAGNSVNFWVNKGNKGEFGDPQLSVKASALASGKHIALYTGQHQSGTITRIYSTGGCISGNFWSWGVYDN